jgi:pyridoxamine 5'-phosphate oxidase-like protein
VQEQKRGRAIAMTEEERDAYLATERVCRVATVRGDGSPHVAPLWFVWWDGCLWLNSIVRSQRWADLARDPRVAVVIDGGREYGELHGVEIIGRAAPVGEAPRTGVSEARLVEPERLFAEKYAGSSTFAYDGRHAWLCITPDKVSSWDFRKIRPA